VLGAPTLEILKTHADKACLEQEVAVQTAEAPSCLEVPEIVHASNGWDCCLTLSSVLE